MRQLAKFQPSAGNDAAAKLRGLGIQARFIQRARKCRNIVFCHIEKEQFLHRGGTDARNAEFFRDIGNGNELLARCMAHGGFYADVELAVLLPVHAQVIAAAGINLERDAIGKRLLQVLFLEDLAELVDAPFSHQKLQPRAVAVAAEAVVAEDADHTGPYFRHALEWHPRA